MLRQLSLDPKKPVCCALWLAALLAAAPAASQEVRQLNRIPTPQAAPKLPPGARAVASVRPVSTVGIEAAVRLIASAWNAPRLAPVLADNFYDKSRLLDALNTKVPRDATLRVLAIQGVQTLNQYLQTNAAGAELLVSRVSVTVRTQVEFNDPNKGFQRLDGTNEFILLVTQPSR
jgi:hypothetical protein